ncbi:MAG: phosphoribosylamine--glycine ligase [Actinobacteria bacterium]|nr:phosphoribosylamine--glycine ligase [Actinomycetota bacterium]
MKVLVIGSGGRENCLAWKISKYSKKINLFAIPGNPGMEEIGECLNIGTGPENFKNIVDFVEEREIDFTVVGPEAPLVDGIVDYFEARGHRIFGPDKKASRIEGSKVFTKELCKKYDIPTAESVKFNRSDYESALRYLHSLKENNYPIVIKADGLAAGKGVIIAENRQQAEDAVEDCFIKSIFGNSGDSVIIEEYIKGFEVSILCLCDGKNIVPMVLAQDYKKIFDGDEGKNTGGMGSYCPVPMVSESLYKKIMDEIIYPTYEGFFKEGILYKGILYGGIIISDDQPFLLEYNCRFGDPETQAILPRLLDNFLELLIKCSEGNLSQAKLRWDGSKCVCVVAASKGYPQSSSRGDEIRGLENFKESKDVYIFHAGTKKGDGKVYTNGGRVLNIVSKSKTFKNARKKVYNAVNIINFDGMQYRKDIALRAEEK